MKRYEVGQEVILERINHEVRGRNGEDLYFTGIVQTVARKWFTVKSSDVYLERDRFSIEDGVSDPGNWNSGYLVHLDRQSILDCAERKSKLADFSSPRCYGEVSKLSLERLREIHLMIFGGK